MPDHDDYDRYDDYDDISIGRSRRRDTGTLQQSGPGMASIAVAAFMFLGFLVLFGVAVVLGADNNNAPMRDDDPRLVSLGLGFIAALGFTLVGLVLGIVGCCQPNRSALCGVLGAIFNAILLFGVFFLMCLGMAMG